MGIKIARQSLRGKISNYLTEETLPHALSLFRIVLGFTVIISIIRFWLNGWIVSLYLEPKFHFSFYGFSWIKPIGDYTYIIFFVALLSGLFVTIGYKFRISIIMMFLSFTYIELMDKTTYLNHYYLVSLMSFMMIFLPGAAAFSIDSKKKGYTKVPKWTVDAVKTLLVLVYLYAGLAKINSDWLLDAQPLKIWLKSKYLIPLIGNSILQQELTHYFFSWGGMLYDISIPFLLLFKRTRVFAFGLVIIFHVLTRILFPPIGMFPVIMILSCLIFFDPNTHVKILNKFSFSVKNEFSSFKKNSKFDLANKIIICLFLLLQFLIPLRSSLYPGELFWTEQGYRFSWRVMLIEKTGYTTLKVLDKTSGKYELINNSDYLTTFQEKQMSFQPDMILEYAHYIGDLYKKRGYDNIAIFAESYVALNGRPSQTLIDPNVNLYDKKRGFCNKNWINPAPYEIKSLL